MTNNVALELCQLLDTRALEETEGSKKLFNIVMFDSQKSKANRSQGFKKKKKEDSRL